MNFNIFIKRFPLVIFGLTSRNFRATYILREKQDATDVCDLAFMELSKGIEDIT